MRFTKDPLQMNSDEVEVLINFKANIESILTVFKIKRYLTTPTINLYFPEQKHSIKLRLKRLIT